MRRGGDSLFLIVMTVVTLCSCKERQGSVRRANSGTPAQERCLGYWRGMDSSQQRDFESQEKFSEQCVRAPYVAKCVDGTISLLLQGDCRLHGGQKVMLHVPDG